jgi:hypothetical protein
MHSLTRGRVRRGLYTLAATALLVGVLAVGSGSAAALQFDVTNTNDSGAGSLRQAVADAQANGGADDVVVQPGIGTINATSPIAWISGGALTIQGNDVVVDFGGANTGFMDNSDEDLTIDSMTITGVGGLSDDDAAPVVAEGGSVTVSKCTITGNNVSSNDGDFAGAVLSEGGTVTVNTCTITGNQAHGTEDAGDGAGAILSEGGSVNVSNSTISGNTVVADGDAGGGIDSEGGDITITGSTINCNSATGGGDAAGGILNEGAESFTIDTSNIVGNVATITGEDNVANGILSFPSDPVVNDSTVSDDTSACTAPPPTTPATSGPTTSQATAPATQPRFTG